MWLIATVECSDAIPGVANLSREKKFSSTTSQQLAATRAAAYEYPESHLILRAIELQAYEKLPQHEVGWLARRTGLSHAEEERALRLLETAGQIEFAQGKWSVSGEAMVDTRSDPQKSRDLRAHFIEQAKAALLAEQDGIFGYNLFSISRKDLERVRAIHGRYFQEINELIAQSSPNEEVVLFSTQLFAIQGGCSR